MSKERRAANAFSLLAGLSIVVGLGFANVHLVVPGTDLGPWRRFLFQAMLCYLAFVTLRTVIVIIFSFADRFFQSEIPEGGPWPMVSILVPCFNEEVVIRDAIDAILKLDYPNFEILVIDDGSTDATLQRAKEKEANPKVRVIHQKNQGKAEALNRGISEAVGELFFSVDADGVIKSDVLRLAVPYLRRNPRLAAVAGTVAIGNPEHILGLFQQLEYVSGLNIHKSAQSFLGAVNIVPGPIGVFRRSAVASIGGYRSGNFAEDCDLTIRLLMDGWRIIYCPQMVAVTEAPTDFASLLKQRYRWARGTIQAIKQNAIWLFRPFKSPRNFFILAYFALETLLLPTANFLFAVVFIKHAGISGESDLMGPFFIQLILLNVVIATYAVWSERRSFALILLSVINPVTYGLAMELLRFVSLLDEIIGMPMSWNKLVRTGNIEGKTADKPGTGTGG